MIKRFFAFVCLSLAGAAVSCAPARPSAALPALEMPAGELPVESPATETRVQLLTTDWNYVCSPARQVTSPHYVLYTTLQDQQVADSVAQVMESALVQYQRLTPDVPLSGRPMDCYVFETRQQWVDFTRAHTGADASVYLHINRGGYTVRDWYVAYYIGDVGTYSVAAHEGFHQFAARHFKARIPPFLEEGISCMFEDIRWHDGMPYWDLNYNGGRLSSLRTAFETREVFTLPELATTHAGQIVSGSRARISAFYGQSWAFARFAWSGEGGRYRAGLQRMLADAARGTLYHTSPKSPLGPLWDPRSAQPILEKYFGCDIKTLDERFRRFEEQVINNAVESEPTGG